MKILLISFFFPPYNAIGAVRAGKLARELVAAGHEVRILTARNQRLPQDLAIEVAVDSIHATAWLNVNSLPLVMLSRQRTKYESGSTKLSMTTSVLADAYRALTNFPDGQIGWYWPAKAEGRKILATWRADIIFASAPPYTGLLVARQLGRISGVPWVAEFRDLWTDNHYIKHPGWRRFLESRWERRTLATARGVVTVSEPLETILSRKCRAPVICVPNGFDPQDFPQDRDSPSADQLIITYTGLVYPGRRDPTALFKALRLLGEDARHVRVRFFGRVLPEIQLLAEQEGVAANVEVLGAVPFRESARRQRDSDILLLLLWNDPSEEGVYTGKLFEYLGARRPILAIGLERGVAADLIRSRGAGLICNKPERIADQLRAWLRQKQVTGKIDDLPADVRRGFTRAEQFSVLEHQLSAWKTATRRATQRSRVVIVIPQLARGGAECHLLQVLPRLARDRFHAVVLCTRGPGSLDTALRRKGVEVVCPKERLNHWTSFVWTLVQIAKTKPDIVHFFLPEAYIVGGLAAVSLRTKPRVLSRRSLNLYQRRRPFSATLERWLHKRMGALLANSSAVARELETENAPKHRIATLQSGIDVALFANASRKSARQQLGLNEDELAIICVANLYHYKGHLDLLAALASAAPSLPGHWKLFLAGRDAGMQAKLTAKTRSLALDEHVVWLGEAGSIHEILAGCDLSVLPSHQEGFPNSIVEAMAAGLPTIATAVGGTAEAFIDGTHGILVPPHDPDALSNAILRLAADPHLRTKMGTAAAEYAASEYTIEACVSRYAALYEALLTGEEHPAAHVIDQVETSAIEEAEVA